MKEKLEKPIRIQLDLGGQWYTYPVKSKRDVYVMTRWAFWDRYGSNTADDGGKDCKDMIEAIVSHHFGDKLEERRMFG